jgi:hypothetical protein
MIVREVVDIAVQTSVSVIGGVVIDFLCTFCTKYKVNANKEIRFYPHVASRKLLTIADIIEVLGECTL